MPSAPTRYRGRFAPSPTGDLHLGSLLTATASYLEARVRHGEWLVRIENIDPPREVPGSAGRMLDTLERFGFQWHGTPLYQSTRTAAYEEAASRLLDAGHAYACGCSRSDIARDAFRHGEEGPIYPGTCRHGLPPGKSARALRVRVPENGLLCFEDGLQGHVCQDLARDIGDFVIRRADGPFAYQLAVVVDDAAQGITHVVRGADLLLSTPRQIWLYRLLDFTPPSFLHVPLIKDADGRKLSKQLKSIPVDPANPVASLVHALELLRQSPPASLMRATLAEVWEWAEQNWSLERLKGVAEIRLD